MEPITVARKPLCGTVAENVLRHGTGGINVDGCRVEAESEGRPLIARREDKELDATRNDYGTGLNGSKCVGATTQGRWPANLIHDGSDEVVGLFPSVKAGVAVNRNRDGKPYKGNAFGTFGRPAADDIGYGDSGSAARFFYCAKASKRDRDEGCEGLPQRSAAETVERVEGSAGLESPRAGAGRTSGARNHHPTVKPTDLMRYLCRLVTPPGGTVLDPFMGSGSTGKAAMLEGFRFIGIEREAEYLEIAKARIRAIS
jgi:site-specific DNA-methyltransferase (adenine-specific)